MVSFSFEASGKVKLPSAEELAKADEGSAILAFTDGITNDGRPYWAYLAVRPSKYKEFYTLTCNRSPMRMNDYGTIIAGGYDAQPPQEVIREMRELYGCDENFETSLKTEVRTQQEKFLKEQQDREVQDIVIMLKRKQNESDPN